MIKAYRNVRYWWTRSLWQNDRDCIVVGSLILLAGVLLAVLRP